MNNNITTDPMPEVDDISLLDLLQIIVENLRLLMLGPLAVGLITLGYCYTIPPTYIAKTQFLPPQQQQSSVASMLAGLGGLGGLAGAAAGLKNPADQFIAYLKSNSIQDAMIDRLKLQDRYRQKIRASTRGLLLKNTFIASSKEGLISLEFEDKDPQFAAEVANAYVEELVKLLGRLANTEAQQRRIFFEKQLLKAKEKLTASEQALKSTGISDSVLKSNPASIVAGIAGLKAQITVQEVKIGAMRGYLAETAPDFKQALNELANLRAQLTKNDKDEATAGSPAGQGDYVNKYREYKYQETLFELFAKQYELARIDEAREGVAIQVLDVAQPPERKAKPKIAQTALIAMLASGFAILVYVFLRRALQSLQRNTETTQKLIKLRASLRQVLGMKVT